MKTKKKLIEVIDELMDEKTRPIDVTLGQVILVWGVLPVTVELCIFYFFGVASLTPETVWMLLVPSFSLTTAWWLMKGTKWWKKLVKF